MSGEGSLPGRLPFSFEDYHSPQNARRASAWSLHQARSRSLRPPCDAELGRYPAPVSSAFIRNSFRTKIRSDKLTYIVFVTFARVHWSVLSTIKSAFKRSAYGRSSSSIVCKPSSCSSENVIARLLSRRWLELRNRAPEVLRSSRGSHALRSTRRLSHGGCSPDRAAVLARKLKKNLGPDFFRISLWCEERDLNPHGISTTSPSNSRVCQFHHPRIQRYRAATYGCLKACSPAAPAWEPWRAPSPVPACR